jgi:proteasome lid subunit RPN8/RPN11
MGKNKKTKKPAKKPIEQIDSLLPQNIQLVGETSNDDKVVYISQSTYKTIHNFTKNKTTNESGGVLVGRVIESFGKTHIVISGFIQAKFCEATPTTLTFTHQTWEHIHKEMDLKYNGFKIVGWIHTHPNFGIFLSEYDKFIQQNFFSDENQVAYVIDPIQNLEGFYYWSNGNITKASGFYLYAKTGEKISSPAETSDKEEPSRSTFRITLKDIVIILLVFTTILLVIVNKKQTKEIQQLRADYNTLVTNEAAELSLILSEIHQLELELDAQQVEDAETEDSTENTETQ